MTVKLKIDAASAISRGAREYQEDAHIADFTRGEKVGIAVLSDGMGGHAAGDLASKIVVTEVFSELTFRRPELENDGASMSKALRNSAQVANESLASYVADHPEAKGMGATLITCVIVDNGLHWISIGDSPLYLFRDNVLQQLNEDHSLGPHIDYLVSSGAISAAEGEIHPERNALTSVILGRTIKQIDCPDDPFPLYAGDTIIVASDGLQFLSNDAIAQAMRDFPLSGSADLADALMSRLERLNDPDLDNVTLTVLRVLSDDALQMSYAVEQSLKPTSKWPFGLLSGGKEKGSPDRSASARGLL